MMKLACSAATLAIGLGLIGCDQEDSVSVTLASVERELATAHPGGSATAAAEVRQGIYTEAISDLQAVARDGSDAQKDAAGLLLAQAHGGMARLEAAEAAELEKQFLNEATRLRALLDLYVAQSGQSAALASVNLSKESAELDDAIVDVDARLSEARTKRQGLAAEADGFKGLADQSAREVERLRAEAGRLRSQALDIPAADAAELAQQAYEIQRQAAEFEVESAKQNAAMEKVTPRIQEQDRLIESLNHERSRLTEARRRVDVRTQDAQQQAQAARAAALKASDEIAVMIDSIDATHTGELKQRWTDAVRHAESAVAAVRQARNVDRATNAMLAGEALQRLGEMHAARARGLDRYLYLLDAMLNAEPALSFATRLTEIEARIEAERTEALDAARQAFTDAAASYQGASVRDQAVRERLDRVQQALQELTGDAASSNAAG